MLSSIKCESGIKKINGIFLNFLFSHSFVLPFYVNTVNLKIWRANEQEYNKSTSKEKPQEGSPYMIVRASRDEYDEILDIMHESFYKEEPTTTSLQITPNPILDEHVLRAMTEGFTLVAKCKYDGNIVGACINSSSHPWDPEMEEKLACSVGDDKVKQLMMFYAYVTRAPDMFRCLGVTKIFDISYLFVKKAHQKKGLAQRLVECSRSLGADAGFPVIRLDATSNHTAKICEDIGMQKVIEIPYCSYLDQKLEPVFKPPWPHEAVKIYADCAPQFNELSRIMEKSYAPARNSKKTVLTGKRKK